MDINPFTKFDEIPSLRVQVIKEKTKCCGLRITKGNKSIELATSLFYSNTNIHFVDINMFAKFDEIPSLPVQDIN